jgi:hypothetical protein
MREEYGRLFPATAAVAKADLGEKLPAKAAYVDGTPAARMHRDTSRPSTPPPRPRGGNGRRSIAWGRPVLAVPLLQPGGRRRAYLPAGTWTDWWTRERVRGPRWVETAHGLDTMPAVPAGGAVVPTGPVMQRVGSGPPTRSPWWWRRSSTPGGPG